MLYDFHKYQNSIKPASIHATYLVYGSKSAVKAEADGDVDMTSSAPEQDDLTDTVPCATMTLVAEDKLQDTLSQYQDVTSLHVYSLSPQPQKDLTSLSDVAQSISEYPALDDAAAQAKKYGGIVNPHLRKRTRKNAPPPPAPTPAATASKPVKTEPAKAAPATTKVKTESVPSQPKESTPAQSFKAAPAPKKAAGGIMQSFAKAAAKPPKPKPVKKEEDTSMALSDDGEADDDDMPAPANKKSDAEIEAARTARKTREDELRRMMEEDEEEEEDEKEDEEMDEPEPEPEAEPAAPAKEEKEPQEVVSSTGDGRRRGKRRVMKKKRILDDQGYMGKFCYTVPFHQTQLTVL